MCIFNNNINIINIDGKPTLILNLNVNINQTAAIDQWQVTFWPSVTLQERSQVCNALYFTSRLYTARGFLFVCSDAFVLGV